MKNRKPCLGKDVIGQIMDILGIPHDGMMVTRLKFDSRFDEIPVVEVEYNGGVPKDDEYTIKE